MSVQLQVSVDYKGSLEALQSLSLGLGDPVQNALFAVGNRIFQDMQRFTPVRTGFLLSTESIQEEGMWAFGIYARAFYAPFVEWGTKRMAPRLFMTKAFELHRDELALEVQDAVNKGIADTFR
jgi:HK97 gp10 family phage protein